MPFKESIRIALFRCRGIPVSAKSLLRDACVGYRFLTAYTANSVPCNFRFIPYQISGTNRNFGRNTSGFRGIEPVQDEQERERQALLRGEDSAKPLAQGDEIFLHRTRQHPIGCHLGGSAPA